MSDEAGRRERKTFEPPPWERDQFEELARRKAREQEQERQTTAAPAQPASVLTVADPGDGQAGDGERPEGAEQAPTKKPEPPGVEDVKFQAMLLELSVEERADAREVRRAGVVASYVLSAAGSVVLGLGLVLVFQGGAQGLAGSSMVVIAGMFVIGFAIWLWYRASRGQGS
ncbi:MAG: hypothetical protein Q7W16_05370 [Coriobacteriia bacterium]|nr:hypothetical protein [Coriobacteriia bacterium]